MNKNRFLLSSSDCELLLEFESQGNIEKTASALAKDPSGVSRQLSKIAQTFPAIEKRQGQWVLTEVGRRLNNSTRDNIQIQQRLFEKQSILRIGTNREFANRIVAPNLDALVDLFPQTQILLYSFEQGTESALLDGQVDIGLDCQRPFDPDIAYKLILDEPIVAVCTPQFYKSHQKSIKSKNLQSLPHLLCDRLHPDKIFSQKENKVEVKAMFNDVGATRAACIAGLGWALLPRYSVEGDIKSKKLKVIQEQTRGLAKYGVWWSRSRQLPKPMIQKFCDWMGTQKL